ncbi:TPA: hypothetical protein ACNZ7J_001453, partial [Enterobacter bugandensis]
LTFSRSGLLLQGAFNTQVLRNVTQRNFCLLSARFLFSIRTIYIIHINQQHNQPLFMVCT